MDGHSIARGEDDGVIVSSRLLRKVIAWSAKRSRSVTDARRVSHMGIIVEDHANDRSVTSKSMLSIMETCSSGILKTNIWRIDIGR